MLAIIPARSGSKGLPGKNTKKLGDKPLIAYTIKAALKSDSISRIIVSTDCRSIADISEKYGAEVPFLRPESLAEDDSKVIDAVLYTLDKIEREEGSHYEEFALLQPTSPLRNAKDIDRAAELFRRSDAGFVISVCKSSHPPQWALEVDKNLRIGNYFDIDTSNKNRQEFKQTYIPNGAIYIVNISKMKNNYSLISDDTLAYVMPEERSIDIDSIIDFKFAEFLMRENNEKSTKLYD